MTINEQLQAMRERVEGATEGPWTGLPDDTWWLEGVNHRVVRGEGGREIAFTHDDDAEFIAAARTDLPRLLAVVDAVLDKTNPIIAGTGDRYRAGRRDMALEIRNIIAEALEGK